MAHNLLNSPIFLLPKFSHVATVAIWYKSATRAMPHAFNYNMCTCVACMSHVLEMCGIDNHVCYFMNVHAYVFDPYNISWH